MTPRIQRRDGHSENADRPTVLIVSDYHVGSELASVLEPSADVRLVTDDAGVANRAPDAVRVYRGELTDLDVFRAAGADDADTAITAVQSDDRNFLVTQHLRTAFDVASVVAVLDDPACLPAFEDVATATVCGSTVLGTVVSDAVDPSLRAVENA